LLSVDATNIECLCKYVNDSGHGNCKMKRIIDENCCYLCLFATKEIKEGEELRYDYGDDPNEMWWRKNVSVGCIS